MPYENLPAEGLLRCDVDVTAPGGRRRVPLAGTRRGRAVAQAGDSPTDGSQSSAGVGRTWASPSTRAAFGHPGGGPRPTTPAIVHFDRAVAGTTVLARRRDDMEEVSAPRTSVDLDLSPAPPLESLSQIEFDILLQRDGDEPQPVLHPDTCEVLATWDDEYYARAGITGGVWSSPSATPRGCWPAS